MRSKSIYVQYPIPMSISSNTKTISTTSKSQSFHRYLEGYLDQFHQQSKEDPHFVLRYNPDFFHLYLQIALQLINHIPLKDSKNRNIIQIVKQLFIYSNTNTSSIPVLIPLVNLACLLHQSKKSVSCISKKHSYKYKDIFSKNYIHFETDILEVIDQLNNYTSIMYTKEKVVTYHHNDVKNDMFEILQKWKDSKGGYTKILHVVKAECDKLLFP